MLNTDKIPYEIEKYIYNFIPIKQCYYCGNYYVTYDKYIYFCGKKCRYIFIAGIYAKLFLTLNYINIHVSLVFVYKLLTLLTLCFLYSFIRVITISVGLLIYNFDVILLAHYFIDE